MKKFKTTFACMDKQNAQWCAMNELEKGRMVQLIANSFTTMVTMIVITMQKLTDVEIEAMTKVYNVKAVATNERVKV